MAERTCDHCGEELPEGKRRHARFCDDMCKARWHARRREMGVVASDRLWDAIGAVRRPARPHRSPG